MATLTEAPMTLARNVHIVKGRAMMHWNAGRSRGRRKIKIVHLTPLG